ncbi:MULTISPECIES: hypothetical protein [unclassified Pseudomonas]|uniref:hypothetical protein n=1 Tax=unclassified Pseudomonas TaxID=196821 RepID=UPI001CBDFB5D|nr:MULTISPECIES: hypothetical protein [unclassified Pseudomonas]
MNTTQPAQYDEEEFALWFCANNDIPEDVYPFDAMDNGVYVWKETRDGLAKWLEMQKTGTTA